MAVFKHQSSGKRILFIHIPRTGGRFIEVNLEKNGWEMEPIDYCGIPHYQHSFIDDCEFAHFHRELYEKYCDEKEQIAVIRDPITRFISASTYLFTLYGRESQKRMEDYDEFVSTIQNFPESETRSWWRPQVEFLTDTTHIWKFEDGLGESFGYWMSEKLEVPFEVDILAKYVANKKEDSKLDKTDKLVDNIKRYYSEDIDQLYPELK